MKVEKSARWTNAIALNDRNLIFGSDNRWGVGRVNIWIFVGLPTKVTFATYLLDINLILPNCIS